MRYCLPKELPCPGSNTSAAGQGIKEIQCMILKAALLKSNTVAYLLLVILIL